MLMGPAPASPKRKGKALFGMEDFEADVSGRTAVCPEGHSSTQCSSLTNAETGKVDYRFEWGELCDNCEVKDRCTRARNGRRAILVGEHHEHLQRRRKEMKTETFAKQMHRRNGIEGTISEFTRAGGRRTRYRGIAKTSMANYFLAAAINVKRWIRLTAAEINPEMGRSHGPHGRRNPVRNPLGALVSALSIMWRPPDESAACAA